MNSGCGLRSWKGRSEVSRGKSAQVVLACPAINLQIHPPSMAIKCSYLFMRVSRALMYGIHSRLGTWSSKYLEKKIKLAKFHVNVRENSKVMMKFRIFTRIMFYMFHPNLRARISTEPRIKCSNDLSVSHCWDQITFYGAIKQSEEVEAHSSLIRTVCSCPLIRRNTFRTVKLLFVCVYFMSFHLRIRALDLISQWRAL